MNTKWAVKRAACTTVFDSPSAAIAYWRASHGSVLLHSALSQDGRRTIWERGL